MLKTGKAAIVFGVMCVAVQLLAMLANTWTGRALLFDLTTVQAILETALFWLGYTVVGQIGVVFLIVGVITHRKKNTDDNEDDILA